jgi:uncharacterized cysteine cluster protein YcgN (CxxCxxCC family)
MTKAWEDLCDGCGKCCQIKPGIACPALGEDNRCTDYKDRHVNWICLPVEPNNVERLHKNGILPDSCAYVRHMRGKPPLPRPVEKIKLIPFNLCHPDIGKAYFKMLEERQCGF